MIVFLNGQFLPEEEARVSIFDRSFLYGDGLFETLLIQQGRPFRWRAHLHRLRRGAEFLRIRLPFNPDELTRFASELICRTEKLNALLRITVSRGVGRRGLSVCGAKNPLLAMSLHDAPSVNREKPAQWRLITSSIRVHENDPLARFKTSNRLHHILARTEVDDARVDEGLLVNSRGELAEGTFSNLFWIDQERVFTSPLASGALNGITRSVILEICGDLGIVAGERPCQPKELAEASGVFLSLSSWGLAEAISLDEDPLAESPLTTRIYRRYQQLVSEETASDGSWVVD